MQRIGSVLGQGQARHKQRSPGHCIKMIKIQGVHSSAVFFLSLLPCLSPVSDVLANFLEAALRALHSRFPGSPGMPCHTWCSLIPRLLAGVPVTGLAETVASPLGSGLGHSDMPECTEVGAVGKHGLATVPFHRKEERRLR